MEVLSEHLCQGWLEGYLLTGRHGLMNSYEAFIHIVDSMFNQHAKWLKVTRDIPWRRSIASLNYLLSSLVWRQDHNGFSHQDPGFIDHVVNKKAEIIRVYLPPDANTLLSVADHCLRSRDYVNVIVAGKQPAPNWLSMEQAILHCTRGIGIWDFASSDKGSEPDVVMACAGDIPDPGDAGRRRHPAPAPARAEGPRRQRRRPHAPAAGIASTRTGSPTREFDSLFTTDRPIVFAYHGYPWLIHRLTYRRTNHVNLHVRGYKEEGTTTTPFDMVMLNDLDRFHLAIDVIDRVPGVAARAAHLRQWLVDRRLECRAYTRLEGEDAPEIQRLDVAGLSAAVRGAARPVGGGRQARPHPCRQRGLEQPEAARPRRRGCPRRHGRPAGAPGRRRRGGRRRGHRRLRRAGRGGSPHRPRWDALPGGGPPRRRGRRRTSPRSPTWRRSTSPSRWLPWRP